MSELERINQEGTTIMLVTHDVKVAAKSDKVLYIEDGNIRGELPMGKCLDGDNMREREKKLNSWLIEMGW
jgi:putative ABC transport system ATP-binding protein